MIRTDFTQGNQFVVDVPIEWISTSRYQRSIYCMLKKKEPVSELHVVADEKVLGTNRHVVGEEHAPIAAPAETHASNLHDDREAWRHVKRLIENWYEPSEVPPVTKEQERGLAPDTLVVASGVVSALESFLAENGQKYNKGLIRRTLKLVTQNPTQEGVRDALKPLFLKKKEKRVPADRLEKCMKLIVALDKRQEEIGEKVMELLQNRRKSSSRQSGRRTECMQQQLRAFCAFLSSSGKVYDGTAPYAAALGFWNRNKAKFDKAAKACGRQKGYSSHKPLADAYHRSMGKPSVR